VNEVRLESIVEEKALGRAVKALHKAHPYEEVAYDLIPLMNRGKKRGYGMVGYLPEPMQLSELWQKFLGGLKANSPVTEAYDFSPIRVAGNSNRKIKKIAIANGSSTSFVQKALFQGADLFIAGDVDYHGVLDSLESGMAVAELGHFLSEIPMIQSLYDSMRNEKIFEDVEMMISTANQNPWKIGG
jgi:putative NIF3 family GTP cyclohydrolase 1 type 2